MKWQSTLWMSGKERVSIKFERLFPRLEMNDRFARGLAQSGGLPEVAALPRSATEKPDRATLKQPDWDHNPDAPMQWYNTPTSKSSNITADRAISRSPKKTLVLNLLQNQSVQCSMIWFEKCFWWELLRFVREAAQPSGGELGRMALTGRTKLASINLWSNRED